MKSVGVDFDGVIHAYSKGWHDGTIYDRPVKGAFIVLERLMESNAVFVQTARPAEQLPLVASWIEENSSLTCAVHGKDVHPEQFWNTRGVLLITNHKFPAIAYLDDRAVVFRSWILASRELIKMGVLL